MLPANSATSCTQTTRHQGVSGSVYPGPRPLLHIYLCTCKFRQTVKLAITTTLPMCRCRHRDDTARDSGPGTSEKPGCHPIHNLDRGVRTTTTRLQSNGPTAGLRKDTELPPMGSVVINVQGATFDLPIPDADVLDRAAYMATEYCNLLTCTPSAPANPVELRATLQRLTIQFSRVKAERIALAETAGFFISER